jgi:hypothetical protein
MLRYAGFFVKVLLKPVFQVDYLKRLPYYIKKRTNYDSIKPQANQTGNTASNRVLFKTGGAHKQ